MTTLDRGFAILTAGVVLLFAFSIVFALLAVVLRLRNDRVDKRRQRLTAAWEPVMLDVLAGSARESAVSALVEPRDHFYFLTFLQGYASRLRGKERDTVRRVAQPYVAELAANAFKGPAEKRGLSVQMLAGMGMPQYASVVAEALDDPSPFVAMIAARGLFRRGQEAFFPPVLKHLSRFTLWSRSFLSSMLAGGGSGTASLLRRKLTDARQPPSVRAVVVDALRLLNDLDSVPIVVPLVETETDRDLVAACLRLIRQLGHRDHVRVVRPLIESPDAVIRAAAAGALGAIGSPNEVPLLQDALDDPAFWVSLEAARGLLALGDVATLRRLAASAGPWAVLAQQVLTE
jgi:HEAT repeat protein